MGCPDWPTCFGRWIPPKSIDDLPPDFEKYLDKQDIDHTFNVFHTWTEYINRLLGVLLGVFIIGHVVITFQRRKVLPKSMMMFSLIMLLLVGFSGWLGKVVVDNNLAAAKISLHMISALILAFVPIIILNRLRKKELLDFGNRNLNLWILGLMLLLIFQLFLGIQLRENIDHVSKALGYLSRDTWLSESGNLFLVHRSFSWFILVVCGFLIYNYKEEVSYQKHLWWFVVLVLALFAVGVGFSYMGFPKILQPIHLLLSLILICICFDLIFKIFLNKKTSILSR